MIFWLLLPVLSFGCTNLSEPECRQNDQCHFLELEWKCMAGPNPCKDLKPAKCRRLEGKCGVNDGVCEINFELAPCSWNDNSDCLLESHCAVVEGSCQARPCNDPKQTQIACWYNEQCYWNNDVCGVTECHGLGSTECGSKDACEFWEGGCIYSEPQPTEPPTKPPTETDVCARHHGNAVPCMTQQPRWSCMWNINKAQKCHSRNKSNGFGCYSLGMGKAACDSVSQCQFDVENHKCKLKVVEEADCNALTDDCDKESQCEFDFDKFKCTLKAVFGGEEADCNALSDECDTEPQCEFDMDKFICTLKTVLPPNPCAQWSGKKCRRQEGCKLEGENCVEGVTLTRKMCRKAFKDGGKTQAACEAIGCKYKEIVFTRRTKMKCKLK